MALISRLGVVLGLDSAEFSKNLGLAEKQVKTFSTTLKVGVAAALTAVTAEIVAATKRAAEYADDMGKAAQKVGVTTEALSALKYAAELSDVGFEQLQGGLIRLSMNVGKAAENNKDMTQTFEKLGVSIYGTNGELKKSDEILIEVSEVFKKIPDGINKTSIAIQLFGKAGAQLIPMLNGGKQAIEQATKEAERFGKIVSLDMAKQAEQFNDNMTRMQNAADGFQIKLGNKVLPTLAKLTEEMIKIEEQSGVLIASLYGLGGVIDKVFLAGNLEEMRNRRNNIEMYATTVANAQSRIDRLKKQKADGGWWINKDSIDQQINYYVDKMVKAEIEIRRINLENLRKANATALPPQFISNVPDLKIEEENEELKKRAEIIARQTEGIKRQIAEINLEREGIRGNVTESQRLNLEFEKGGRYYEIRNSKLKNELFIAAELREVEKEAYERQQAAIKLYIEQSQLKFDQKKQHNELLNSMKDEDEVRLRQIQYERELVNLSDTQQNKARQFLELREKILKLSRDTAFSEQEIADIQSRGQQQIIAMEETARAQRTFQAGWNNAYENFIEKAKDSASIGAQSFQNMAQSMEAALDRFVETGKISFSELTRSIIADLIKMQLKAQATGLFQLLLKGIGSAISGGGGSGSGMFTGSTGEVGGSIHIGARANGGDITAGAPYLVGERGPELIIPKSSGTVIPNHSLSSNIGQQPQTVYNGTVIQNMNAIDTQTGIQFLTKNKDTIWAANQSAQRSLPMSR